MTLHHSFTSCYDPAATQEEIFENDVRPLIDIVYNGVVSHLCALYALEELENNFEWLEEGLKEFGEDYLLFDCPGQVELYTHHNSLRNIFYKLQKLNFRVRQNELSKL